MNLRWRLCIWLAERNNRREINQIVRSKAYNEAMQWRDWDLCDSMLAEALDRQYSIQLERRFVVGLRESGL